jgi:hypothetical protein
MYFYGNQAPKHNAKYGSMSSWKGRSPGSVTAAQAAHHDPRATCTQASDITGHEAIHEATMVIIVLDAAVMTK